MQRVDYAHNNSKRWRPRTVILFLLTAALTLTAHARQQTIFVHQGATGSNDGSTWENAFVALQDAIAASSAGDAIWIAEGTYRPDEGQNVTPGDRAATFLISHDLSLFGGFAGNETIVEAADPDAHSTILSGDLLGNDGEVFDPGSVLRGDNSHRVLLIPSSGQGGRVTFFGLTVQGSEGAPAITADGVHLEMNRVIVSHNNAAGSSGGGLRVNGRAHIRNSAFQNNRAGSGGALYATSVAGIGDIRIDSSLFEFNRSDIQGGAIQVFPKEVSYVSTSLFQGNTSGHGGAIGVISPFTEASARFVVSNTVFRENIATDCCGGGIAIENGQADVFNSVFVGNRSERAPTSFPIGGGSMSIEKVDPLIVSHSLFSGNHSMDGSVVFIENKSHAVFVNSIIYQNSPPNANALLLGGGAQSSGALRTSIIDQTVSPGIVLENTINSDPELDDDLVPTANSAVVDAGDNSAVPADLTDLDNDGDRVELIPFDLGGHSRIAGSSSQVDLGPFEYQPVDVSTEFPGDQSRSDAAASCMAVHPNPASSTLRVVMASSSMRAGREVRLIDTTGRVVATHGERSSNGAVTLSVQALPPGVYLVDAGGGCVKPVTVVGQ